MNILLSGEGYNVNIPWNRDRMGNTEYRDAFLRIVTPIISQFKPDLTFVACGFDAAAADIIGEYVLTPQMYGYMTRRLLEVTNGKILLALEGGYNPVSVGQCLECCLEVCLSNDEPDVEFQSLPCKRASKTLTSVIEQQSKYWKL